MSSSNPYSSERPAGPEIFVGYDRLLGSPDSPQNIVERLTSIPGEPSSYWIVGERKMGKTSFLLKLENLLFRRTERPGNRWVAIPLYVSCQRHVTLLSFYQTIFERVCQVWEEPLLIPDLKQAPIALSIDACKLPTLDLDAPLSADELLEVFRQDLGLLVGQLSGENSRLVVLIDDVDTAVEAGWVTTLCGHLKSLLTDMPRHRSPHGFCQENLAVVIASHRELEGTADRVSRLTDVLDEVVLKPLPWSAVRTLVTRPPDVRLEIEWVDRIYQSSAGHPWLVQYIMEEFCESFGQDRVDFERNFDSITGKRFQRANERLSVLCYWFDRLPDRGAELLVHLAIHARGMTLNQLCDALDLSPRTVSRRLRQMRELGIVYKRRPAEGERADRYAIGDIFKTWFLEQTGGNVLQQEINNLRSQTVARDAMGDRPTKPFYLLMSTMHDMLIADGLCTRFFQLGPDFTGHAQRLTRRARDIDTPIKLSDTAADLKRDFIEPTDWIEVWDRYCKVISQEAGSPRFIFKSEDVDLLDFPIELVEAHDGYLGLRAPIFKEVIGLEQDRVYHLSDGCFPRDEHLNVLLVASSFKGQYQQETYPPLPNAEAELGDICQTLLSPREGTQLSIDNIVILINEESVIPEQVRWLPATAANFEQTLRGELGINFHLLHYSGHYIFSSKEEETGLLFKHDQQVELFNLARLSSTLTNTQLRFAYFNGCSSGQHQANQVEHRLGAAYTCLKAGVPVVIGMRWPISDTEGRELSRFFYDALAQYGVPEVALWKARIEAESKIAGSVLWAAPVMLTR